MPILKICHHVQSLISSVGKGSGKTASARSLLLINPRQESLNDRFLILETAAVYLFVREFFFTVSPLIFKQFIAIEEALYGRIGIILFLTFRNGLQKISSDVCITAAPFEIFQFVISGISIYIDICAGADP